MRDWVLVMKGKKVMGACTMQMPGKNTRITVFLAHSNFSLLATKIELVLHGEKMQWQGSILKMLK